MRVDPRPIDVRERVERLVRLLPGSGGVEVEVEVPAG